jgi:transcriptional/translational regulatory protein YebC/TACO1
MFGEVNKFLDEKGVKIEESQLEYMPHELLSISDITSSRKIMKFIEMIEEVDDVQNVFTNFEIDDSISSELE